MSGPWLSRNETARRLNIDPKQVARAAAAGGIRTRCVPGTQPKYHADDVEVLARQSVIGQGVNVGQAEGVATR